MTTMTRLRGDETHTETAAPRAPERRHGTVAVTLVVLGVYLMVLPFALSLFSRAPAAEKLADRYRSFATKEGLAQFSKHTDVVVQGGQELLRDALPRYAGQLHMNDAEFNAFVDRRFPNVAVYRRHAPEVFAYLTPAVAQVAGQADNVHDADDFPVAGVPVTVGTWALLGAGLVLVSAGLWFRVAPRRVATAVALVVGLGLVAGPLVLGWPHKVDAAEKVATAARVAFTPAVARATTADTYMIDAAVVELREAMLPAIGSELGRTRAEMEASVASEFPALSTFLTDWKAELSANGHELSQSQIQFMDEFHEADATPYRALPWLLIVPGLIVAVIAMGAVVANRRSQVDPLRP